MSNYATHAYKTVGVNTAVEAASPHKLILMLYDGLLRQLRLGKAHMIKGDLGTKAACLSKAVGILDQGLRAALDDDKGGELAVRLRALYDYAERRVVHANARNEADVLDEVIALIEPLRSAWATIGSEGAEARAASGGASR
jgi:flagellar secretion chaperone FliS